ncbi:hypothetical protein BVX97_05445, partial [bacterium E08(2017)]
MKHANGDRMIFKKRLLFFTAMAMLMATAVFAAPYNGEFFTYYQPDGTAVEIRLYGDEYYAVAETLDGYTVTRDLRTGEFCYARLAQGGRSFISTGKAVGKASKAPAGLQKKLRLAKHVRAELVKKAQARFGVDEKGRLLPEQAAKLRPQRFGYKKWTPAIQKKIEDG